MGPCFRRGDDLEEAGWPFHIITSCSSSLFEHDLRANAFRVCREGKPVSTFPDHALRPAVDHLWKEVAPTFGRHVEETPERVDKIAGAMVLFRGGRGKAHLRAPEVPDRAVCLPEDVEDCFVPVVAVRNAMLGTHSLGKL